MVPHHSSARVHSRSALVATLLLFTLGLAGVMAYQAWDATRSHQEIAEDALWDHTQSAAWLLASAIRTQFFLYHMKPGLDLVAQVGGTSPEGPFKDLEGIKKIAKEHSWPYTGVDSWSSTGTGLDFVFRFDVTSGEFQFRGDKKPSDEVVQWLRTRLKSAVKLQQEGRQKTPQALVFHGAGAEERALGFAIYQPGDRAETAFGFQTDLSPLKKILEEIGKQIPLIPPALTKGQPNEELLSYVVRAPSGMVLFQSYPQYPPKFEVTDSSVGEHFGDLTATVILNPEAAEVLVIGGLPKSRLPTILGLLALASAMVLVAIFQLRREQELALLRTDFVSSVSHQLRTPLAQIRMFGETLLLGRVRNEEEAQRSLEIIVKEAQGLTHHVDIV